MMRLPSVVRDLALLCVAAAIGWWGHGAGTAVLAQRSSSSSSARGGSDGDAQLAFQLVGGGPAASLALYNSGNHTLYVYNRVGEGNSYVSCSYSFTISRPGAPIQRENCPVGDQVPQR